MKRHPATAIYPRLRYRHTPSPLVCYAHDDLIASPAAVKGAILRLHRPVPVLFTIALELGRWWSFGLDRKVACMAPYIVRDTGAFGRYRNPTVTEVARACLSTPGSVYRIMNAYNKTTTRTWIRYIAGKCSLRSLIHADRPRIRDRQPLQLYSPGGGWPPKGQQFARPALPEPITCAICNRRPRVYRHKFRARVKCDRDKNIQCPYADQPIIAWDRASAIEAWNEMQGG